MTGNANRPSEASQEWVINSKGERVRNDAYRGSTKTFKDSKDKSKASRSSAMDTLENSAKDRDMDETEWDNNRAENLDKGMSEKDLAIAAASGAGFGIATNKRRDEDFSQRDGKSRTNMLDVDAQDGFQDTIVEKFKAWFNKLFG